MWIPSLQRNDAKMSSTAAPPPPTWEACKENVVPIKRGRSAKGLTETLDRKEGSKVTSAATEQAQEDFFEARLTALAPPPSSSSSSGSSGSSSPGVDSKGVLDVYVQYFKWVRDTYPADNTKALTLLERCTCALKDAPALRNDPRFVKMWVEYADLVRTPGEVFSFMQSRKIGEGVALFWVAWAFVAEKVGFAFLLSWTCFRVRACDFLCVHVRRETSS